MAWFDRIINIDEAMAECKNCPNNGLRVHWVKTKCATCIYYDLLEQMEVEEMRQKYYREHKKEVCDKCKSWWKHNCDGCWYNK